MYSHVQSHNLIFCIAGVLPDEGSTVATTSDVQQPPVTVPTNPVLEGCTELMKQRMFMIMQEMKATINTQSKLTALVFVDLC